MIEKLPRPRWIEMTTKDFEALDVTRVIAVIPVGAIEQHGPHLPVAVDSAIVAGIVDRLIEALPDDLPVTFLPVLPIGKSDEHMSFPGTLTLSAETLIRYWTEIAESVARAGIRKLVFLNGHGGQPQIAEIVSRDLRIRHQLLAVAANYWAVGHPSGLFPEHEIRHGIHGGSIETSLMLRLRPDLVRNAERRNFESHSAGIEKTCEFLRFEGGGISIGWQTQDLNRDGACGDALDADPTRGETLLAFTVQGLIRLLREIDAYPLSALAAR